MPGHLPQHASAHALLIEDDPVSREFLGEALSTAGWEVELAADVASALLEARRKPPDLILCDLRLPDGDAFDLARALWPDLAALTATRPRTYAVALSAELDEALRTRLHRAGYQRVLSKPVSLSTLLAALPAIADSSAMANLDWISPIAAPSTREPAGLDDAAALSVCGTLKTVDALRALLANELTQTLDAIRDAEASGDTATLRETLHRLRSACGFCGAAALDAAVAAVRTESDAPGERAGAVAQVLAAGSALALQLADRSRRGAQQ